MRKMVTTTTTSPRSLSDLLFEASAGAGAGVGVGVREELSPDELQKEVPLPIQM